VQQLTRIQLVSSRGPSAIDMHSTTVIGLSYVFPAIGGHALLKPNSITLSSSKLVGDQLRTS